MASVIEIPEELAQELDRLPRKHGDLDDYLHRTVDSAAFPFPPKSPV